MPHIHPKAVVWLVPSDAILTQTYRTLTDKNHNYRKKIDVDFGNKVEIYSKQQLLNGQNFNPTSVSDNLSVFVLSYDSFRTSKKDGRKAYQENGSLLPFVRFKQDSGSLLEDTDETALIQVIRKLNPVVIVDESHHATSKLSKEMLQNFNPSFVLDLTATPKNGSNIISFVDARQLKAENMVKLPVIVYNRKSQEDVFVSAISLRRKLENEAVEEQKNGGRYIRPIVLFQAQPRTNDDSTTYDKIKHTLIDMGIPESEIAIKTADRDELKNIDLSSHDCSIRYIITVNALKEGWDCPFAYILATVANRTSSIDVEQILGRILRLIYLHYGKDNLEEYNARLDMKQPIITILDRLTEKIQNENKIENVQIGLFRLEVADFSEKVFQEALLNALSHRDYQQMGAVYVKHYPDKIVIENPGGFLDGITADNIITHPSAPRNKLIAETLQSLKYVQRTGQGVDIIYKEMVSMGKPYPVYRVFSDSVQLTIESAMEDPDFVRFIVKEQDSKQINLSLSQLMILRYIVENRKIKFADVQKVAQISAEEARKCCAELMKFGLIEITGKEYMLTARVYEAVKSDIEYTRDKTVQYIKAKDMITEYIKLQGYINRSTVQELCGFTDQQARRTIEKMKEENIIEMSNGGRYAKYILKEI